ncbi:MAG: DUF4369 domain-containing protein [Prevotella sp.]|nr:DUF4369 domain-containing protein [Prevotella sp.]
MKRVLPFCLLVVFLLGCGGDRQNFVMEGVFKGFNQGELYIYGFDGSHQLDTVAVVKGRFRYDIPLEDTTLFVMVFPNYSELPVLGIKGATVKVEGDASHLRETKIKEIKENEHMTNFRRNTSGKTPPEMVGLVAEFIKEHPASPFAPYLVRKYFVQTAQPDYQKAAELLKAIQKAKPNTRTLKAIRQMEGLTVLKDGGMLPSFTATDINGRMVKSSDLNAKVNVITVWADWSFESTGLQQRLQAAQRKFGDDLKVVSICLNADVRACRRKMQHDSVKWSTICDGRMWDTPLLQKTGLSNVPDNIITDSKGKIIAHSLNSGELIPKIEELLPR